MEKDNLLDGDGALVNIGVKPIPGGYGFV